MNSLTYALLALFGFVGLIVMYGFFKGGTEKMLENELNHNTVDATTRIETTRYIDFFKQVKRVDSIYVNEQTKTLQIKKNNRLSPAFLYSDILSFNVQYNDVLVNEASTTPLFMTQEAKYPEDVDHVDWSIEFKLPNDTHIILFDSFESFTQTMHALSIFEKNALLD